jgi:hypothetical protein
MRYILFLVLLAGCGVRPEKTDVNVERYENLVQQLNKVNSSTYEAKTELKTELKENTELLKSVKEMTESIQKSLCEHPKPVEDNNFVEAQPPVDVHKEVEKIFEPEDEVVESEPPAVQNDVLLVKHSPTDFNCGWCGIWDKQHKSHIVCDVKSVNEHSSVGRKKGKGYPYFELFRNGQMVYSWTGSVHHSKMNAIINQYVNYTEPLPALKWSVGTARNPWKPTKNEIIQHLISHHNYSMANLENKGVSDLIEIHNRLHNANRR